MTDATKTIEAGGLTPFANGAINDVYNDGSDADDISVRSGEPMSLRKVLSRGSGMNLEGTYASQNGLPRLPIPALEETLAKLPKVLEAIQDNKQRERTAQAIQEFLHGAGPTLQKELLAYEKDGVESGRIGSYVEEFWNDSYLSPDSSVVLNLNPFFQLEDGPDPKTAKDQLRRAASICFASAKLASSLKHETLSPDIFKGKPLCMDQFKALFSSSRQPQVEGSDDVHVYGDSCHAVDEGDLLDILRAIHKHAYQTEPYEASKTALGVLTALPRSEWAVAREEICETPTNRTALNVVDSALFVLVLDDFTPHDINSSAANMLHGTNVLASEDTAQIGSCVNRFYDKLQIIVCKDGSAGINFEHSAVDGHTALRFVSDVFAETVIAFADTIVDTIHGRGHVQHLVDCRVERAVTAAQTMQGPLLDIFPKKLVFDLSPSTLERIYFAETTLCDEIFASDTFALEFTDYGKNLIVGNEMSPDSLVQMSILIAYYKLYGRVVCMYEPVLTKHFYHGRTEAMRSATPQAKRLCQVWCNKASSPEQKLQALRIATIEHSRLVKESASGKGVDRHLFALKCIADRKGVSVPFFQSEAWKQLNHTILSTSNCGNPALRLFGFGPVVPDGFGVGYIIKDQALSFVCVSKHRQTQRYVRCLQTTLREMKEVMNPLSKVQVKQRPTLRDIKQTLERQNSSFGTSGQSVGEYDIYGESTVNKDGSAKKKKARSGSGRAFTQVKQLDESLELLNMKDIQINVNLDEHTSSGEFL